MIARTASNTRAIRPARSAATLYEWLHAGEPEYDFEAPDPGPNECVAIKAPHLHIHGTTVRWVTAVTAIITSCGPLGQLRH